MAGVYIFLSPPPRRGGGETHDVWEFPSPSFFLLYDSTIWGRKLRGGGGKKLISWKNIHPCFAVRMYVSVCVCLSVSGSRLNLLNYCMDFNEIWKVDVKISEFMNSQKKKKHS